MGSTSPGLDDRVMHAQSITRTEQMCACGCSAKSALNPVGIYGSITHAQTCLSLTWTLTQRVLASTPGNPAPNCLRMAFHDAGTYSTSTDTGG